MVKGIKYTVKEGGEIAIQILKELKRFNEQKGATTEKSEEL